ncbi:MAG: ArdC-like ssDNA-binding domain-containing protein [Culicoidibacterales bacterium]
MATKKYTKKTYEEVQESIKQTLTETNEKIKNYFDDPDKLLEFLEFMDGFHNYSTRNVMLIQHQYRGAMAVAPFAVWQKEHDCSVLKGQKAIDIVVPQKFKVYEVAKDTYVTYTRATDEQKEKIKQNHYPFKERTSFTYGKVFDITQTNFPKEKYPDLYPNRHIGGDVNNYEAIYGAVKKLVASKNVGFGEFDFDIGAAAKGYVLNPAMDKIYLNPNNTQTENILTTMHELAHTQLHKNSNLDRGLEEYQAEMVSYLTAKHFGLEHEQKSIKYIANWAKDKKVEEQLQVIDQVRHLTQDFIHFLEPELAHLLEKNNDKATEKTESLIAEDSFDIYAFCDVEPNEVSKDKTDIER